MIRLSNTRYALGWIFSNVDIAVFFFSMCAIYIIYMLSITSSFMVFFETSSKSKLHKNVHRCLSKTYCVILATSRRSVSYKVGTAEVENSIRPVVKTHDKI